MVKKLGMFAATLFIMIFSDDFGTCCSAENDKVQIHCLSDSNAITVFIKNYDSTQSYSVSINGGRYYIPLINTGVITLHALPDEIYQICAMKNNDTTTLSDMCAVKNGTSLVNANNKIDIDVTGIRESNFKNGGIRVDIKNFSDKYEYMLSLNGGKSWLAVNSDTFEKSGLFAGNYCVIVKAKNNPNLVSEKIKITVPVKSYSTKKYISTPLVRQLPELPTGCEITSLTMVLNHYGFNVNKTVLSDSFLDKGEYRASDYRKVFVGNPREYKSYGCYSDVIENCANNFLSKIPENKYTVINITDCQPERLYSYIDMGYPVIVWATSKMVPTQAGPSWIDKETGEKITWVTNEHCMVLTGYNIQQGLVIVNDPQYGVVTYDMDLFEERFYDLEQQAIVIVDNSD